MIQVSQSIVKLELPMIYRMVMVWSLRFPPGLHDLTRSLATLLAAADGTTPWGDPTWREMPLLEPGKSWENMGKPWENPWTSSVNMSNVDLPCDSFLEGIWEAERPKGHTWLERLEADTSISGSKGRRKTKNSGFYICLAKPTSWYSSQKRLPWNRTVMSIISSPTAFPMILPVNVYT